MLCSLSGTILPHPLTEAQILEAIRTVSKTRTIITVSHRLSGILDADIVHIMDKGRIRESGRPEKLTEQEGWYSIYKRVQIMHLGSFDDEPVSVALMDKYLEENSYATFLIRGCIMRSTCQIPERLHLSNGKRSSGTRSRGYDHSAKDNPQIHRFLSKL